MPELPEVETIRQGLQKSIIGKRIKQIKVLNPKSFQGGRGLIKSKEIILVWRRAKILGIDIEGGVSLLFHLKMSGQVILNGEVSKSTRVIFILDDDSTIIFNDQRKFGWVRVVKSKDEGDVFLNKLGPEPLEDTFTFEVFKIQISRRKKTPIKVALLDQTILAGVGNIYACEAVFLAGVDPSRRVGGLTEVELRGVHRGVVKSLQTGVDLGGSSKHHFVDVDGKKGNFLSVANVYARERLPCRICKSPIKKIKLGGRGTFFCSECQK